MVTQFKFQELGRGEHTRACNMLGVCLNFSYHIMGVILAEPLYTIVVSVFHYPNITPV